MSVWCLCPQHCKICREALETIHHCRKCGDGFCDACSDQRMPVPELGWGEEPVRVCSDCYNARNTSSTSSVKDVSEGENGEEFLGRKDLFWSFLYLWQHLDLIHTCKLGLRNILSKLIVRRLTILYPHSFLLYWSQENWTGLVMRGQWGHDKWVRSSLEHWPL